MLEADRYKYKNLYILGMIFLLLSIGLLAFSLYLAPYFIWGWNYDLPEFIPNWQEWLKQNYQFSQASASFILFFIIFLCGILSGFLSNWFSNRIENNIFEINSETLQTAPISRGSDTMGFTIKILLLILAVFVGTMIFEWLIEDRRLQAVIIPNSLRS